MKQVRNNEVKGTMNKNDSSIDQSGLGSKIQDMLDIKNLKYLNEDKINSFKSGYESNNYLILAVMNDCFESFKFLLMEKNTSLLTKNSNGWNAFHFICKLKKLSK